MIDRIETNLFPFRGVTSMFISVIILEKMIFGQEGFLAALPQVATGNSCLLAPVEEIMNYLRHVYCNAPPTYYHFGFSLCMQC